jgi:hypothetical protein
MLWKEQSQPVRELAVMPETDYLSKTQAISAIMVATGYGRRVIEKILDRLTDEKRIRFVPGFDGRTLHISRTDVELVIKVLKHEIE